MSATAQEKDERIIELKAELEEAKQQNDILTVDIEMGLELLKEAEEELEEALKGEQEKGVNPSVICWRWKKLCVRI